MSRLTRLAALTAVTLVAGPAASADAATLSGQVRHCVHGGGVAYAPLTLEGPSPRQGAADANGNFAFYNLPSGTYRVTGRAQSIQLGQMIGTFTIGLANTSSPRIYFYLRPFNTRPCIY